MIGTQTIGRIFAAAALLLAGACATTGPGAGNRQSFGHVAVHADPPAINTQVITKFDYLVEDQRFSEVQPGNMNNFAYSLESDGCLHGQHFEKFCRREPAKDDRPELTRWRSTTTPATFATTLSPDSKTLVVEAGNERGVFALGQGPALDELRQQPWMLGLAFASGHAPHAKPRDDGASLDYHFVVEAADP